MPCKSVLYENNVNGFVDINSINQLKRINIYETIYLKLVNTLKIS